MIQQYIFITAVCLLFAIPALASVLVHQEDTEESWKNNELLQGESSAGMEMLDGLRNDVLTNGCGINICFVMDGSDGVGAPGFLYQKNFIDLLMAITTTDRPGRYCAVQYHNQFTEISPLIDDREDFLTKVHDALKQTGAANITPGLRYAVNQLVKRKGIANKIVLFSQKMPNISPLLPPVLLRFFNINGVVCSVALNPENRHSLIHDVTGDPNLVFPRDGYFEISEVIFALVHELCEM